MMKFILLAAVLLTMTISGNAQQEKSAIVDNKSVIETADGGILIFNNFNKLDLYFYFDYKGDIVSTTERRNLFQLGETALQVLALDKTNYQGESDNEILKTHAKSEIEYISNYLKIKLEYKIKDITLNNGIKCILWDYKMPESVSKEVISQLYISFIYKAYIIGVNTAQFSNQTYDEIFLLLKDICEHTYFSKERITLEYLCENRRNLK